MTAPNSSRPPERLSIPIPSYDEGMMRAFLSHLMDPGVGAIEFRVLDCRFNPNGLIEHADKFATTLSGWYDDVDALVVDLKRLHGVSGYLTVNPLDRDLLARSYNKLAKARTKESSSDSDVVQLRWLFLDIDPIRKAGISSTDAELANAVELRDQILAENPELARSSICGRSGNGCWILVRLPEYPNDSQHREYVGVALEHLASRYTDARVKIDSTTRNPSRVMAIPGTVKCKGSSLPHRPWRLATIDTAIVAGDNSEAIPAFDLMAWLESQGVNPNQPVSANHAKQAGPRPQTGPSLTLSSIAYVRKAFQDEIAALASAPDGNRNNQLNETAFNLGTLIGASVLNRSEVEQELIRVAQQIGLQDREIQATIASGLSSGEQSPRDLTGLVAYNNPASSNGFHGHPEDAPRHVAASGTQNTNTDTTSPESFDFTDLGNARRLVYVHGHRIRYCKAYGDWLIYDGRRWLRDERHEVERLAKDIPGQILREIPPTQDEAVVEGFTKWYMASQAKARMDAAIALARSEPGIAVTPNQFDADPWILNVQNGTIDLRTGKLRPHSINDLITKLCPVNFDHEARAPRWEQFEREIFAGDTDLVAYMRRAAGYATTALDEVQEMHLLYGDGSNGKNVYLDTIRHILGDYACQAEPNLLLATRFDPHPAGIADLQSRRFVMATETDDGRQFAESMVKRLTGDRQIKARFMRENFFEFPRTFKLFLATNAKPEVRGSDHGIWRRIRLIPFTVKFLKPDDPTPDSPPELLRIEPGLEERLLKEAPGILAILIRGCLDWQNGGMRPPDVVVAATEEYRSEMDQIAEFLRDRCDVHPGTKEERRHFKTMPSRLFQAYSFWCEENGYRPISGRKFARELTKRGFEFTQFNSQSWRFGIQLKDVADPRGYGTQTGSEARRRMDYESEELLFDASVPF